MSISKYVSTPLMNKLLINFSLATLLMGMLVSCTQDAKDQSGDSTETTNTVYVENPPTYPVNELPEGLKWETNNSAPLIASPEAKKGGEFRVFIESFPLTLRVVGPDSNSAFRDLLLGNQLSLTDIQPNTEEILPSLATRWAYDKDGRTVYYELNPDARWSDGSPVTADDYVFVKEFMQSEYIVAPWYNKQYTEEILDIKKYDDYTISVTGARVRPKTDLHYYYGLTPKPRHFHILDKDWVGNYNWRVEPNTGPYQITEIKKGKYIIFSRKKDWWGKDLRFYKNRFNADKIKITIIRDRETAYRHFLKGELDAFSLLLPSYWHDKATGELYDKGYIYKIWFYNDAPQPAAGLYLNQDKANLDDINIRLGLHYSMNFEKVINTILRGDYMRLNTLDTGYGKYTNNEIKAREFDLKKADEYFSKAGWSKRGPDGIRIKDGKRLSFAITYGSDVLTEQLVVLKEEAKKAGVELKLEQLDPSAWFKKVSAQNHEIVWLNMGGGIRPQYWGAFHSDNAHKPNTNNLTATDDPEIDALIDQFRTAVDESKRQELARAIQQKIHDLAVIIPRTMAPFARSAYWRWMKLPDPPGTKWSESLFEPMSAGLFWIDEDEKERTFKAIENGETFEPVTIIDTTYKAK